MIVVVMVTDLSKLITVVAFTIIVTLDTTSVLSSQYIDIRGVFLQARLDTPSFSSNLFHPCGTHNHFHSPCGSS